MTKPLVNKVAQKSIVSLNLEDYIPDEIKAFDLKPFLFQGLLLKEKEFRTHLKELDLSTYKNQCIYIHCSSNAIIPMWAYMLVSSYLSPIAKEVVFSESKGYAIEQILLSAIQNLDVTAFQNQRVVVKGCGKYTLSPNVYIALVEKLQPIAKAINFGEACSMVPVYKKSN